MLAIHDAQIAEHGGAPGIRDGNLLESALARPQNLASYNPQAAVSDLAATYALGILQNHPFIDGNKRVALVALELFLELNNYRLNATALECYSAIVQISENSRDDERFIAWVRTHVIPPRLFSDAEAGEDAGQ